MFKLLNMGKKLLLFVSIVIICSSAKNNYKVFKEDCDKILWSSKRKLIWDDFRGSPQNIGSIMLAGTYSNINVEYNYLENEIPNYKIECNFIKSKSWTVTDDIRILAHEQLHFDISELYTRKIRKSFDSLKNSKNKDIDNYDKIYYSYLAQRDNYDKLYDSQVYGNNIRQQQWIKKVGAELLRFKKYEYVPEE